MSYNTSMVNSSTCFKCGKFLATATFTWNSTLPPEYCNCNPVRLGWICSRCNKSVSPDKPYCDCCDISDLLKTTPYNPYVPDTTSTMPYVPLKVVPNTYDIGELYMHFIKII